MIEQAEVLSPWVAVTTDGYTENVLAVRQQYPGIGYLNLGGANVDSKYPDPNAAVALVTCDTLIMDKIEADLNYVILEGTREPKQRDGLVR